MNFHPDGFIYFHNWATFISLVLQTQTRFRLSLDLDLLIMFSESLGLLVPYSPVRISAYDGFGSLHCYQGMPLRVISGVLRIDPPHPLACHMRRWQRRHSCRVLRPVMVEDGIMVVEAYPKRLNIRNVRLSTWIFRKYPSQTWYICSKFIFCRWCRLHIIFLLNGWCRPYSNVNIFSADDVVCTFISALKGGVLHMVMYISFLQMVPSAYSFHF